MIQNWGKQHVTDAKHTSSDRERFFVSNSFLHITLLKKMEKNKGNIESWNTLYKHKLYQYPLVAQL